MLGFEKGEEGLGRPGFNRLAQQDVVKRREAISAPECAELLLALRVQQTLEHILAIVVERLKQLAVEDAVAPRGRGRRRGQFRGRRHEDVDDGR